MNKILSMENMMPQSFQEALEIIKFLLSSNQQLLEGNQQLQESNQKLLEENETFRNEIEKIRARLNKNSRNSSKPPSTDIKGDSKGDEKKPGPKCGHKAHFRKLLPSSDVTETISVMPKACPRCGSDKFASERKPHRHQVTEIPKIKPNITEYRLERCRCSCCGKHFRSQLPKGVSQSVLGANLTAFISELSCQYSMPIRKIKRLLKELIGCSFSPATIIACQKRTSSSLKEPYEQLKKDLEEEAVLNADETSWRTHGKKRWAWLAAGAKTTVLMLKSRRNRESAEDLLGKDSTQPLVTDRYSAYAPKGPHQFCLAHWKRDIESLKGRAEAKNLYETLRLDLGEVFSIWKEYQEDQLDETQFRSRTNYRRQRIRETLEYWVREGPTEHIRKFCKNSLKRFDRYWTYTRVEGMEPTNNKAERELRPLVIRRKICFGTKSASGEEFIARGYSVSQTLMKRGLNTWQYFREALERNWSSMPPPSLQMQNCV